MPGRGGVHSHSHSHAHAHARWWWTWWARWARRWWPAFDEPVLPVAAVERDHSVVPLAAVQWHHTFVPVAAVEWLYTFVPVAAVQWQHALVHVPAVQWHHTIVPLATWIQHAVAAGLDNPFIPDAAVKLQYPVVPFATAGRLDHAIVPDATVKLQHPVVPLAAAEHADDTVLPVSAVGVQDASRRPRAASPDVVRQAGRAVRAAAWLVRPQPVDAPVLRLAATFLRQPHHAAAAHRVPRVRGAWDPNNLASIANTPRYPVVAIRTNNAVLATALRAAVPGQRAPEANAVRREPAVPSGLRRGVRITAATREAVQLVLLDGRSSRPPPVVSLSHDTTHHSPV